MVIGDFVRLFQALVKLELTSKWKVYSYHAKTVPQSQIPIKFRFIFISETDPDAGASEMTLPNGDI